MLKKLNWRGIFLNRLHENNLDLIDLLYRAAYFFQMFNTVIAINLMDKFYAALVNSQ